MQQLSRNALRVGYARVIGIALVIAAPAFAVAERPVAAPIAASVEVARNTAAPVPVAPLPPVVAPEFDPGSWDAPALGNTNPEVFALALEAAAAAVLRGDATEPATLTVIDFSRPSTAKRMWVYDLRTRTLLFEELVAHGRNSGHNLTTTFSNQPESHQSSLGLYRTAEGYVGKHGYSLRLDGLEPGFNDRARDRAIVIHGAEYVNGAAASAQGRLGRSLGCPAVRPEVARELIDAVKGGGLVFAYYPDPQWLGASTYLN